jgi:tetratricopeptide (TPR) repeat protein
MQNNFANGRKRACVNLARAYVVLKRFREAAKMFQERLADVEKSDDNPTEFHAERAWLLHDIARCLVESGQLSEALGFAEESSVDADLSKEKQWILNSKVLIAKLQGNPIY